MNDIKAGDLVMVVKPTLCCGCTASIGTIFTVKKLICCEEAQCFACGHTAPRVLATRGAGRGPGYDIETLKRIEPPSVTEDVREETEVPA